ncbi:MAG TPA: hypothetical protein VEJ16_08810 [Alphaproteobacteria bacterium]|nr:hypothetical protein [Alphaproteobacteria bacterium]
MTVVSPYTTSTSATQNASQAQTSPQTIDDLIQTLEKQIAQGVSSGTLTSQQANDLTTKLDAIKQQVDQNPATGTLTNADLRKIGHALHHIGRILSQGIDASAQSNATPSPTTPSTGGDGNSIDILT